MSKPRRPFGDVPGRLPATMIKVLAAELSDQGRLARGKRYHADDSVVDIVVGHGVMTAEIQGSRREPYIVTIATTPGSGVPTKREVRINCTCPDDTGVVWEACKHAVAALFALSDEVSIDPDVLTRWRGGTAPARPDDERSDDPPDDPPVRLATVTPIRRDPPRTQPEPVRDPTADQIALLLSSPAGAVVPDFPPVEPIDHVVADRRLAEVLDDALDHLMIDWG